MFLHPYPYGILIGGLTTRKRKKLTIFYSISTITTKMVSAQYIPTVVIEVDV